MADPQWGSASRTFPAILVILSAACSSPELPTGQSAQRAAYVAALGTGACEGITVPLLAADCWLALAARTPVSACSVLGSAAARDECWFLAAERSGHFALCEEAGEFAQDCARHLFIAALPGALGEKQINPINDSRVEALIVLYGIREDTMRAWLEYYKWALSGGDQKANGAACDAVADRGRHQACSAAAAELREQGRGGR